MSERTEPVAIGSTFLIWDNEGDAPDGNWTKILWRDFNSEAEKSTISVPRLVEEDATPLRERYLAWIYELGEQQIDGKSVREHLQLRPGFSYWWMTLLAEKSSFKTPRIFDVIRLLALEEILQKKNPQNIILVSGDKIIADTIRSWCIVTQTEFEWRPISINKRSWIKRFIPVFPYTLLAFYYLSRYLWKHWPAGKTNQEKAPGTATTSFIDCLIYLKKTAFTKQEFESNYWGDLTQLFKKAKVETNWIHYFTPYDNISTSQEAANLVDGFSRNSSGLQWHTIIDEQLNLRTVLKILRDHLHLVRLSIRLKPIKEFFKPENSQFDFWALYKNDWLQSIRGSTAVLNMIFLNLFEETFRKMPKQEKGVYIQENQSWEIAFVQAWRSAGHGHLIGVPHTTVRYWDIRYFFDPRVYKDNKKNGFPRADQLAINGPAALKMYREGYYPENELVEVEALRYLYLAQGTDDTLQKNKPSALPLKILVCGDVMWHLTNQMLKWLEQACFHLQPDTTITVKPHPFCPINSRDYPGLKFTVTDAPLVELFTDCNTVFVSNSTSAAVDAYCYKLPVIQVLNGDTFNVSALRGMKGVCYVTNPKELVEALGSLKTSWAAATDNYFCLDTNMPRWQNLLGFNSKNHTSQNIK